MNAGPTRETSIDAASKIAEELGSMLGRYGTRASRGPKLLAACLAATISDGLVAVIHVIDSHGQAHAPTLVRGMIESLLDLEMICANEAFVDPLRLATAQGKIATGERLLSQAKMLTEAERTIVRNDLRNQKALVADLTSRGVKPLDIADKFKRAPNSHSFRLFYWHYSSSVHNDLQVLVSRHLREGHIVIGNTLSDADVREILTIGAGVALCVYDYAPKFLRVRREQLQLEAKPLLQWYRRIGGRTRS